MKTKQINLVKQVKYVLLIAVLSLMACKQDKTESMPEKANEIEVSTPKINLQEAVITGNRDAVIQHIKAGSDLNETDAFSGATPLITAITFDKTEIAKDLIEAGSDLSIKNNDGSTALHVAAFFCRVEVVKMLLDAGANKMVKNNFEATPRQTVLGPFEEIKPFYEMMQQQLSPLGFNLDLAEIEKTRPVIAMMLQ